jgi:hypothetical protein
MAGESMAAYQRQKRGKACEEWKLANQQNGNHEGMTGSARQKIGLAHQKRRKARAHRAQWRWLLTHGIASPDETVSGMA